VVLMDLQMPVLDGIEAIRRLRAAEARRDKGRKRLSHASLTTPDHSESEDPVQRQFVIALSANSDADTRQEALSAGADLFIPKPFTYESFVGAVSAQLTLEL
jgi:CheY-like chemotaxis protein